MTSTNEFNIKVIAYVQLKAPKPGKNTIFIDSKPKISYKKWVNPDQAISAATTCTQPRKPSPKFSILG
ncbi:hypothetical protein HYFRA_00014083 [Hymenoscyphus fraxineus]|uniref:Uncharacterized protein n=1 Tax=Hymenoscyphus fraxineus TaxID=746836 RepID=A0A9N9PZZ2_9HELO|nr:hypothetical protein HYFRA_00014083 [Hymenoscyphus fraxineus]